MWYWGWDSGGVTVSTCPERSGQDKACHYVLNRRDATDDLVYAAIAMGCSIGAQCFAQNGRCENLLLRRTFL